MKFDNMPAVRRVARLPRHRTARRGLGGMLVGTLVLVLWAGEGGAARAAAEGAIASGWLGQTLGWIEGLGWVGGAAFAALYVLATVAFVPGSLLTLGAGVLFGPVVGSMLVFGSATMGAIAAFSIGRYLARDWVFRKFAAGNAKFAAIDRAVGADGFKIVLLTRLSPIFPFNALNYLYGLTGVTLRDYAIASVGMLPGTVLYVYLGSSFKSLAELFSGTGDRAKTPLEWSLYALGLVATVAVTVIVTRIARRALARSVDLEAAEAGTGETPPEPQRSRGGDGDL